MELYERLPKDLMPIIDVLEENGAEVYLVGGCVRDHLLGNCPKDFDLEIYHMPMKRLQEILSQFGKCDLIGRQFGILKLFAFPNVDFALPRLEEKNGSSHRDFMIKVDPYLERKQACRRRDFTMNAILYRIVKKEFIDPYDGRKDIENKVISIVDQKTFIEDPLRVYRLIQFSSRLDFKVSKETMDLCKQMVQSGMLDYLTVERVEAELKKLLLASKPWVGLDLMKELKMITRPLVDEDVLKRAVEYREQTTNPYGFMWSVLYLNKGYCEHLSKVLRLKRLALYVKANLGYVRELNKITSKEAYLKFLALINGKTTINDLYYLRKCQPILEFDLALFKETYMDQYGTKMIKPLVSGKDLIQIGFRADKKMKDLLDEAYCLQLEGFNKSTILEMMKGRNVNGTK